MRLSFRAQAIYRVSQISTVDETMNANARQFGNFLLLEFIEDTHAGELWRGCRLWADGREDLWVEKLATSQTSREQFITDLRRGLRQAILSEDTFLAPVTEFGMIQRQYYVAGLIAEGQNLKSVMERCQALNLPIPVSVALMIARDLLMAIQHQMECKRDTVVTCRSVDSSNIWLAYDGRLQLGWSGIETAAMTDERRLKALRSTSIRTVLDHLGALLSIGRQPHADGMTADAIPDDITHLVRDAIVHVHGAEIDAASLCQSLETHLATIDGQLNVEPGVFVSSIFTRERSIRLSKKNSEKQMIVDMPHGARAVIARASGHVLVSSDSHRVVQTIDPRPVITLDESTILYEGSVTNIDIARLIYRYAASNVTGQLHLDHGEHHVQLTWKNGQIIQVASQEKSNTLLDFLVREELMSEQDRSNLVVSQDQPLDLLVPAIVSSTSISHYQLLEACEQFAHERLLDTFGWGQTRYRFTNQVALSAFQFSMNGSILGVLNEGIRTRVPHERIQAYMSRCRPQVIRRRHHKFVDVGNLRLTTKQLRVWNAIVDDVTVDQQLSRLGAMPGVDQITIEQVFTIMERLDFISFEAP